MPDCAIQEGIILERRQRVVNAPAAAVYRVSASLGGETGWLYCDLLYPIHGFIFSGMARELGRRAEAFTPARPRS